MCLSCYKVIVCLPLLSVIKDVTSTVHQYKSQATEDNKKHSGEDTSLERRGSMFSFHKPTTDKLVYYNTAAMQKHTAS